MQFNSNCTQSTLDNISFLLQLPALQELLYDTQMCTQLYYLSDSEEAEIVCTAVVQCRSSSSSADCCNLAFVSQLCRVAIEVAAFVSQF